MKQLSRRQFIALIVTAVGTGVGGVALIDRLLNSDTDSSDNTPASLDLPVLDNLMALVDTFVGDNGSTAHYRTYFAWRAENLPNYHRIYGLFSIGLDESAQVLSGQSFISTDTNTKQAILQYALALPEADSALLNPTISQNPPQLDNATLDEALWLSFDRYVLGEIVTLFLQTNAWLMLGYDGYPSQGRGLNNYTEAVGQT